MSWFCLSCYLFRPTEDVNYPKHPHPTLSTRQSHPFQTHPDVAIGGGYGGCVGAGGTCGDREEGSSDDHGARLEQGNR